MVNAVCGIASMFVRTGIAVGLALSVEGLASQAWGCRNLGLELFRVFVVCRVNSENRGR